MLPSKAISGAIDKRIGPAMMSGMTKDDVLKHFGSQQKVAEALGITQPSVANWDRHPPPLRQLQIEALTAGELRAEPDCDQFRFPLPQQAAA